MSDNPARKSTYAVDTNILMDWQARYYPTDVFESLVACTDRLIDEGRFVAPDLVKEEIQAVGTNALNKWADQRPSIWISNADVLPASISVQDRFPGLLDPKAEHEEADAYVIGLALMREGIVVTSETSAAEKRKPKREFFIPDVCRELGVSCINLLGLMRREGWRF